MKMVLGILLSLMLLLLLRSSWVGTQPKVNLRASETESSIRHQTIPPIGNLPSKSASGAIRLAPVSFSERILTNGVIDLNQGGDEFKYDDRIRRHVQLRAILNSPVRDTEECLQIAEIVIRHEYRLDLLPMAYSYAWQMKDFKRRFPDNENGSPNGEAAFRMGMLQTDFITHLERTYGRVSQQFVDELLAVAPTRDFGRINTHVSNGEPLYEEVLSH